MELWPKLPSGKGTAPDASHMPACVKRCSIRTSARTPKLASRAITTSARPRIGLFPAEIPGHAEQHDADDQRGDTVLEADAGQAGFRARNEGGERAGGDQEIDDREHHE